MIFTLKKAGIAEYIFISLSIFLLGLIVSGPGVCTLGARRGLKICCEVLIPSLFPFSVPVLFLIGTNAFKNSKNKTLFIFILSMLGGYPIGAKLIVQSYSQGNLDEELSRKMFPFCVNAGPAFIVVAVGKGILKSANLGYVLLISHLLASIIIALVFLPESTAYNNEKKGSSNQNVCDNFVSSIYGASTACISICAYVIFFSVVNQYIVHFSQVFKPLKIMLYFMEVTSALSLTKSIYVISFLLGFAGVSIWMQVFSMASEIRPNMAKFTIVRILHGGLSTAIAFIVIRLFKISITAISNNVNTYEMVFYSDLTLSLSLLAMAILLIIGIISKNHSGNILRDVI